MNLEILKYVKYLPSLRALTRGDIAAFLSNLPENDRQKLISEVVKVAVKSKK